MFVRLAGVAWPVYLTSDRRWRDDGNRWLTDGNGGGMVRTDGGTMGIARMSTKQWKTMIYNGERCCMIANDIKQ